MKIKRLLCIALIVVLFATWPACAAVNTQESSTAPHDVPKDDYHVSLYGVIEGNSILQNAEMFKAPTSNKTTQPADLTKTLNIDGKDYALNYTKSEINENNEECYYYSSDDGNITAAYLASTLRIISLTLKNQDMSKFVDMDLAEYEEWIRQFVAQFSEEDWSTFLPHYATYMRGTLGANAIPEYVTEFEEDYPLSARQFTYHSCIGDYKTTDLIRAMIDFGYKAIWFDFNHHRFDSLTVDLDMDKINTAITNFTTTNMRTGSTLKSVRYDTGTLHYIDGNFLYSCFVYAEISGSDNEYIYKVMVDIPDFILSEAI